MRGHVLVVSIDIRLWYTENGKLIVILPATLVFRGVASFIMLHNVLLEFLASRP